MFSVIEQISFNAFDVHSIEYLFSVGYLPKFGEIFPPTEPRWNLISIYLICRKSWWLILKSLSNSSLLLYSTSNPEKVMFPGILISIGFASNVILEFANGFKVLLMFINFVGVLLKFRPIDCIEVLLNLEINLCL